MRSYRFVERGADRYVVGEITPFDQKNEMFRRCMWDPKMLHIGKKFFLSPPIPRNQPGYRLPDLSLKSASWHLARESAQGTGGTGGMGLYAWDQEPHEGDAEVPLDLAEDDPDANARGVKRAATLFGASLVGVCKLDRRWLYSAFHAVTPKGCRPVKRNVPDEIQYVIAIAIEMDYETIRYSPTYSAGVASGVGYSRMAFTAGLLAQYIRGLGYRAIPCGNDTACSIPIAIDAGLGEMARNGLLITPRFGPRVRLAKVLTDMPLTPDKPIEFGVWDFCKLCNKCAKNCPGQSIPYGEPDEKPLNISNREGVSTWHINAEKCLAFWAVKGVSCSNCIRTCPFNKPNGMVHDWVRWGVANQPWLNRLFLWADDRFGYGKKKKPETFWQDDR